MITMNSNDLTDVVRPALAALAVFAQALLIMFLVLAVLALFWGPARRLLAGMRDVFGPYALWMALAVAVIAVAGSLFFSEVSHFVPCRLCWFQRICMYPLVPVLLAGALRRDAREAFSYAFVFPLLGSLVSAYHLYIEAHPEAESASCKIGVPCSVKWINEFGYVTIPMLALTAFAAIFVLLLLARSAAGRAPAGAPVQDGADAERDLVDPDAGISYVDRPRLNPVPRSRNLA
jgi:disulfide bond formation protein DsbB